MKQNREQCIGKVLEHEGLWSNHPDDPGGPTMRGITLAVARQFWKANATAADLRAMTKGQAMDIYRARYWSPLKCDELPSGVDYSVFDWGVNSGVSRAAKALQRIVGVTDDGKIGPITLSAVGIHDPEKLVIALYDERLSFLKRLRAWPVFGKGWGNRVRDVRAMSIAMARSIPHNPAVAVAGGKAIDPETEKETT